MALNFLIRTDKYGVLEEIFFSEPVSLITGLQSTVFDMLHPQDKDAAKEHFQQALLSTKGIVTFDGIRLQAMDTLIYCHLVSALEHVMILASDTPIAAKNNQIAPSIYLMERCMRILLEKSLHTNDRDFSDVANHFEQIQMLNNELVNTHRKLQQANAHMKRLNEDLNNRLVKDPLTGLISRYQYRSEIQLLIEKNPEAKGVFCFIDIDDFKKINDSYGHATGDLYLVEFSKRLKAIDMIYPSICMRIAGDEFGLYIHGMQTVTTEFVDTFWNRFSATILSTPIETDTLSMPISCSLGMARYGEDTTDVFLLIDYADFAMYQAKRSGKHTYRLFDPACKSEFAKTTDILG